MSYMNEQRYDKMDDRKDAVSLRRFEKILRKSWSDKTSALNDIWVPSDPGIGQSDVTALVVNDYFGGRILRSDMHDGSISYCNELDGKPVVQLTATEASVNQAHNYTYVERDEILHGQQWDSYTLYPTHLRYSILKHRVDLGFRHLDDDKVKLYFAHPTPKRVELRDTEIFIESELGIELQNPFYDRYREDVVAMDKGIMAPYSSNADGDKNVEEDLRDILSSSGLLSVLPKDSGRMIGSSMEIFYNSEVLNRPTYLIIQDNSIYEHIWLVRYATERFGSADEFVEWWKSRHDKSV